MNRSLAAAYPTGPSWDELFAPGPDGAMGARPEARRLVQNLEALGLDTLAARQVQAEASLRERGVTFGVYGEGSMSERILPFDLIPRVMGAAEWARLERGLVQRVQALECFLDDLYGDGKIFRDGLVPKDLVQGASGYLPQMLGLKVPGRVRVHVAGIDLIRDPQGHFLVLEDNLRCPSGVSYVLENRAATKRLLPEAFEGLEVAPVARYPDDLLAALGSVAQGLAAEPQVAVLSPGHFNSAFYEHAFLARQMGVLLVEGRDLRVEGDRVEARTTRGWQALHSLYRRIDDAFLDPQAFRPDSLLGVPGLFGLYARGKVVLANAPGNGVADDKAIYPFVPAMVRYYLGEDAILGQVPTLSCLEPASKAEVLGRLHELVVKRVDGAGGAGMLIGPGSTKEEQAAMAASIEADPRAYIAQPVVQLSRSPVLLLGEGGPQVAPRHVDLRPFVVQGAKGFKVLAGGLTRVALTEGSLVVNSSRGGGGKDTWVLGASC